MLVSLYYVVFCCLIVGMVSSPLSCVSHLHLTYGVKFGHPCHIFIFSLQCIQAIGLHHFISMCVPWELNPQPFALLNSYKFIQNVKLCLFSVMFLLHKWYLSFI